jgi:hypothetical protein
MAESLSDEDYLGEYISKLLLIIDKIILDSTELPLLLNELIKQINVKKPDNPWEFSSLYFQK